MNVIDKYSAGSNFWEIFPQWNVAGPFRDLWASDKSPNKAYSSKLMWTVAFIWDRDSIYYNLDEQGEDGKIILCFEDYFGDKTFYSKNKAKVEELRSFYLRTSETPARRTLRELEEKLQERSKFLRDTPYDIGVIGQRGDWVGGTAELLDKMAANTKKLYDQVQEARAALDKEDAQSVAKGGGEQTMSDRGEI